MMKLKDGETAPVLDNDYEDDAYDTETVFMVHDQCVDLEQGEIYLFSDIEWSYGTVGDDFPDPGVTYIMAMKFIKNLRILSNFLGEDQSIIIHMNTPGGCWRAGMACYMALQACPQTTIVLNYGEARSMSSLIPQAADLFYMMPKYSRFMYHTGYMGGEFTGTQMDTEYREWKLSQKHMDNIYIDAIKRRKGLWHKKTRPQIRKILRAKMKEHEEVYLDPEEAVAHGFADGIFDGDWSALDALK